MPVDRGLIDAQLREIGEGERWWEQREFRDLPHILHGDERIQAIVNGKVLGRRRPRLRPSGPWLLVATSQRLLCLKQERFARRQIDVAWSQVVRARQSTRLRGLQIVLETADRGYRLLISKDDAFRFTGALAPLLPSVTVARLHPDLEPLSWLPGITTVAALPGMGGIVSKVAMLSPPDYAPRDQVERLEATVEGLQGEVERLREQVAFLEELIRSRAEETLLPRSGADR